MYSDNLKTPNPKHASSATHRVFGSEYVLYARAVCFPPWYFTVRPAVLMNRSSRDILGSSGDPARPDLVESSGDPARPDLVESSGDPALPDLVESSGDPARPDLVESSGDPARPDLVVKDSPLAAFQGHTQTSRGQQKQLRVPSHQARQRDGHLT